MDQRLILCTVVRSRKVNVNNMHYLSNHLGFVMQVNVYNNTVTVYLRNANAESEQIKREAIALARRNTVQAESAAYSQVKAARTRRGRLPLLYNRAFCSL